MRTISLMVLVGLMLLAASAARSETLCLWWHRTNQGTWECQYSRVVPSTVQCDEWRDSDGWHRRCVATGTDSQ